MSPLWLVTYAVRSETASVAVVEAENEQQAKDGAIALEQEHDSFMVPYLERELEHDGRVSVTPIRAGLQIHIDAAH